MENSKNTSKDCKKDRVVVIVGPTGSGKTKVGIKIAKRVGGEIISADSRAIYKGLDIGTAKPTYAEQHVVPHWGLDLVEPGERFTVADWKQYAEQKIKEIQERGKVPIIVGGTGLYVDALIFDYQFTDDSKKSCADREKMGEQYLVVGVQTEKMALAERLATRIGEMFAEDGLFSETARLVEKCGVKSKEMTSNAYRSAWKYMKNEINLGEAMMEAVMTDIHLAKRQMTWFKRNKNIHWMPLEQICDFVIQYM